LKSNPFTVEFLTLSDVKDWEKAVKKQEKVKFVKELVDLFTPDG
jgi:hypothetical protein